MNEKRITLNIFRYTELEHKSKIKHQGDIIVFDNGDLGGQSITFERKSFICGKLIFENFNNSKFQVRFDNCIFDCEVEFEKIINSELQIIFKNCRFKKDLNINQNKIKTLNIFWDCQDDCCNINSKFSGKMSISGNKFEMFCKIGGLNQTDDANFSFIGNIFLKQPREIYPDSKTGYTICAITNCKINNGSFNGNIFYLPFDFSKNTLKYKSNYNGHTFKGNKFQKAFFSKTDFGRIAEFFDCDFCDTTLFDEIKNIKNTNLHFRSCKFTGFTHFGLSEINSIVFEYILFERNASFKNSNFNFIKFEETKFEKGAFFDDLNKNNSKVINDWNRTTVREIKRELANSHNQIDYLRFKAYELKAYKKEKGKNWKDNLILFLNEKSNYFGLDWTKGLWFTTITGFMFYLLYLCTYAVVMKNTLSFPNTIEAFFVGYLKFLNPFSLFKSPIENAETYFFPLFFFMFGKIFISYGIFQTVQAFRKFGVNGG